MTSSFKTPDFWYRRPEEKEPPIEKFLRPFSWLYSFGHFFHQNFNKTKFVSVPVVCIGNLTAGGAGKTPVAMAVMDILKANFSSPFFLTRGYGGEEVGPARVRPHHTYVDVGDEALLLAGKASTIVSADRFQGALYAIDQVAGVVVMDDGLQNPHLHKDIKIVVVNGAYGFGNEKLLPAGPLRQSLKQGLARASAVVIIGEDKRRIKERVPDGIPVFQAELEAEKETLPSWDTPLYAFSGIATPDKFFDFLRNDCSLSVIKTKSFPDHHPFTQAELAILQSEARSLEATLITTEKDFVRLPEGFSTEVCRIKIRWQDEASVRGFLLDALSQQSKAL